MYSIAEGQFTLATPFQDKTINVLQLQLDGQQAALTISRDQLNDQPLAEYVAQQLELIKTQFKHYQLHESETVTIAQPEPHLPLSAIAIHHEYQFKKQTIFQRQCGIQLANNNIIVFSLTLQQPFTESNNHYWQQLIQSFSAAA